jgi:hypothetical protein
MNENTFLVYVSGLLLSVLIGFSFYSNIFIDMLQFFIIIILQNGFFTFLMFTMILYMIVITDILSIFQWYRDKKETFMMVVKSAERVKSFMGIMNGQNDTETIIPKKYIQIHSGCMSIKVIHNSHPYTLLIPYDKTFSRMSHNYDFYLIVSGKEININPIPGTLPNISASDLDGDQIKIINKKTNKTRYLNKHQILNKNILFDDSTQAINQATYQVRDHATDQVRDHATDQVRDQAWDEAREQARDESYGLAY